MSPSSMTQRVLKWLKLTRKKRGTRLNNRRGITRTWILNDNLRSSRIKLWINSFRLPRLKMHQYKLLKLNKLNHRFNRFLPRILVVLNKFRKLKKVLFVKRNPIHPILKLWKKFYPRNLFKKWRPSTTSNLTTRFRWSEEKTSFQLNAPFLVPSLTTLILWSTILML